MARPRVRVVLAARTLAGAFRGAHYWVSPAHVLALPSREISGSDSQYAAALLLEQTDDPRLRAQAMLALGDPQGAIRELKRHSDNDAERLSDLAAAYLAESEAIDAIEPALDAAVAARTAIDARPDLAAAHFNLGRALERLGLSRESRIAFVHAASRGNPADDGVDDALALAAGLRPPASALRDWSFVEAALRKDADPARDAILVAQNAATARRYADAVYLRRWANARVRGDAMSARAELSIARRIGDAFRRTTGDALVADVVAAIDAAEVRGDSSALALARTHLIYIEGRLARSTRDDSRAVELLTKAAEHFEKFGSPLSFVARYYKAGGLYELSRIDEALAALDALEGEELDRKGYLALSAQLGWERGICLLVKGSFAEALDRFDRSRAASATLGASDLVAKFDGLAGEALEYLGRPHEGWNRRAHLLRYCSDSCDSAACSVALTAAASFQIAARQYVRARVLLDYAIGLATRAEDPIVAAHAFAQRSVARDELGETTGAAADRRNATAWLAKINAPGSHDRLSAEIQIAEAVAKRAAAPRATVAQLDQAIGFLREHGQTSLLPRLFLEKARASRRSGNRSAERADLRDGLLVVEQWKRNVRDLEQRAAVSVWGEAIRTDLVALELEAGDVRAALDAADDRIGAEAFALDYETHPRLTVAEIQAALAPGAAIVEYAILHDRGIAFVIRADSVRAVRLPSGTARILAAADGMRDAVGDELRRASITAYEVLFAPIARLLAETSTIAVIAPRALSGISFGALFDCAGERYLGERLNVIHASTASAAIVSSRRATEAVSRSVLVIGANAFDTDRHRDLDPLHFADREASAIAALTDDSTLLSGASASVDAVRSGLARATIFHYAGHITGRGTEAKLVLSTGDLSAREVARLHLDNVRLAVLAGCRSSDPAGDSIVNDMSAAFLAAGVPTVIASTADIDDGDSPRVMRALHVRLREGHDQAESVRRTLVTERQRGHDDSPALRLIVVGGTRSLVR